jgi:hypothetical protein
VAKKKPTPKKQSSKKASKAKPTAKNAGTKRPTPPPTRTDVSGYELHREKMAGARRAQSASGREIGPIPDVADPDRRESCRHSLRKFCETYNPDAFGMGWSDDHLRSIARIEEAVTLGALYAFAEPRGNGKTTRTRMAALWAAAYALCRYVFVIGATDPKAADTLDALRVFVRFLPAFAADFPEVSHPVRRLDGIAQRAGGQTCGGLPTMIQWAGDKLVLPTVPPPANWPRHWPLRADGMVPTSGVIVSTSGLTGEGIRGSLKTLTTGEQVRPDLVLLDDPQTNESSRSRTQNETREQLITADVLGMAGPGRTISAVMPCTVITPGDCIDRLTDRKKHPMWRGERSGILKALPKNLAAWDEHYEVYRADALKEPPDFAASNADYAANREVLDEGAEAAWEARKLPTEVSAIQHAMYLRYRGRRSFMSEYMNDPEPPEVAGQLAELDPEEVAAKLNKVARGTVPPHCTRLTAGVDVGGEIVYWCVCAWGENFSGAVVDYGTFPKQSRGYFAAADARPAMSERWPNHNENARVYAGVKETLTTLLARKFPGASGGEAMVETALVDSGKWAKEVAAACRELPPSFARCAYPSKGYGSTARPMNTWEREADELPPGDNWRNRRNKDAGVGRLILMEVNHWKSFVARSLLAPEMGPGCLQLFGSDPDEHRLFADHLTAEVRTVPFRRTTGDQREVEVWQLRAGRPDNHWWDALVMATVAASVAGLKWDAVTAAGGTPRPREPRPKKKLSDIYARKHGGG